MKIETPIKAERIACLHCGLSHDILPMDAVLAVGFGNTSVSKNGFPIYDEHDCDEMEFWTTQDAESAALKDPDSDWRIHFNGPLSEKKYQRQGKGHWVLYEEGEGFA